MYVVQCTPLVTLIMRSPNRGRLQIEFRSWLQCPICRSVEEVVTHPDLLPQAGQAKYVAHPVEKLGDGHSHHFTIEQEPNDPDYQVGQMIARAMQMVRQHRPCKHCGVVSAVPELDAASTKKNLEQQVTPEWLRQEVQACTICPTDFEADKDAKPTPTVLPPAY